MIQGYPELPSEWKSDQSQARSFAIFYESHVKKGTYKMNAEGKVCIVFRVNHTGLSAKSLIF